jgi:hypothetical protein
VVISRVFLTLKPICICGVIGQRQPCVFLWFICSTNTPCTPTNGQWCAGRCRAGDTGLRRSGHSPALVKLTISSHSESPDPNLLSALSIFLLTPEGRSWQIVNFNSYWIAFVSSLLKNSFQWVPSPKHLPSRATLAHEAVILHELFSWVMFGCVHLE